MKSEERDSARSDSFDISYLVGHRLSDDIEKVQKGNLATVHKSYGARTEQKSCTVVQKVALVSKGIIQGGIGRTGCLELCVALQPLLEIEPNQKGGGACSGCFNGDDGTNVLRG